MGVLLDVIKELRTTRSAPVADSWAGSSFEAFGARVAVWTNDADLLPSIDATLPPGALRQPLESYDWSCALLSKPGTYRLSAGGRKIASGPDLASILSALASSLDLVVALHARSGLFVHAGVVGLDGRAIVIPGRSGTGKTTLTAALVTAGATYYSDEYAVFDGEGFVHPYRRPLRMRSGTPPEIAPENVLPIPVGLVAITEYALGATWEPTAVPSAGGAVAIIDNTVIARTDPERTMSVAGSVVGRAAVVESPRGEATSVVPELIKILEGGTN